MTPERWKKISSILKLALERPVAERSVFLAEECGTDAELRAEVESFLTLESNENFANFFADIKPGFSLDYETLLTEDFFLGKQIGKYRVIERIGEGGMGVVYLAERTDGEFEQKVAIKFLRQIYLQQALLKRFLLERQILAKLQHRFIAQLIDGGATAEGTPYLVMEYVKGMPITEYVQKNNLTLRERLLLFIRVCEAVSFAHQNSVIHRDLKPDNILINSEGKPKLLDFGIAKLLSENEIKATVTRQQAFTPEFASPEQVSGKAVTTVSDIYVLGIILYEILTNTHPLTSPENIKKPDSSKSFGDIINPSLALLKKNREKKKPKNSEIKASQLKGDLDNLILKALRLEPSNRYQSVEGFVEDIERYLDGLPILARPATFGYKTQKFVARNKIPVIAGLLIFLILITGSTFSFWQASEARKQAGLAATAQKKAEAETQKAKKEEEKAKKITAFMEQIISFANPGNYAEGAKYGGQAKVIDALNEMSDKIDTEFSNQPDIQSELHHKFAEVYNMSVRKENNPKQINQMLAKTRFHARRAIRLRKSFYGEKHELVAKDMFYLWSSLGTDDPHQAKLLADAIQMMRETNPDNLNLPYMLSSYAKRLIDEDEKLQESYRQEVIPKTTENKYAISERLYKEALPVFIKHYKHDDYSIIITKCQIAFVQIKQNKLTDFETYFNDCKKGESAIQIAEQRKVIKDKRKEIEILLGKDQ
jgi:serine/threonine protein kinase